MVIEIYKLQNKENNRVSFQNTTFIENQKRNWNDSGDVFRKFRPKLDRQYF